MNIIIGRSGARSWVAACFRFPEDATRCLFELRERLRANHGEDAPVPWTVHVTDPGYPLYVIETHPDGPRVDHNRLTFTNRAGAFAMIRGIQRDREQEAASEPGGFSYLNLFRIEGDWPGIYGADAMLMLPHWRVDGETLDAWGWDDGFSSERSIP